MQHDIAVSGAVRADDGTTPNRIRWEAMQRRHRLVAYLESRADHVTVDRLVDALASDDEEPLDRTPLRIRLVHVDLPRLEDAGTIAHDADRGSVRLVDEPDWHRSGT